MKKETVHHILEVGTQLMLEKGYHSLGINEVLDTARIPKGSFYYYFKNKEDFGAKVIEHYAQRALQFLKQYLEDDSKAPKDRIIALFEDMKPIYKEKEYKEGCLLGNCSLELSDRSETFSRVVASGLDSWQSAMEQCIAEGQQNGSIKSTESPAAMADFILSAWEGSLIRIKSSKEPSSYNNFVHFLKKYII